MNCHQEHSITCKSDEFACQNNHQCIPLTWVCDNEHVSLLEIFSILSQFSNIFLIKYKCYIILLTKRKDCADESDEKSCANKDCEPWMFKCSDGRCIYSTWRCGKWDLCFFSSKTVNEFIIIFYNLYLCIPKMVTRIV